MRSSNPEHTPIPVRFSTPVNGELHVAYQTLGSGSHAIVFVAPLCTNIEVVGEQAAMAQYLRRLS